MPINKKIPQLSISTGSSVDADIQKNFVLDRGFGDTLVLPFAFNQVKIQPNEIAIADNINAALYKLYTNFLYLNARCKLSTGEIPNMFNGVLAASTYSPIIAKDTFVIGNHYNDYYIINKN